MSELICSYMLDVVKLITFNFLDIYRRKTIFLGFFVFDLPSDVAPAVLLTLT